MWLDLPQQQNYRTIGDATLEVFQHVVASYDFSFVLKVQCRRQGAAELQPFRGRCRNTLLSHLLLSCSRCTQPDAVPSDSC